ncbi:hypothetical protein K0U83_17430 [bacterium]|nr:hypothetical protein [bacterium]
MAPDPKTQARDALAQQEAIGRAVKRGYAQCLRDVCERLGLPLESTLDQVAIHRPKVDV